MADKGQGRELRSFRAGGEFADFVLDKSIFSNIFDKDIRRVYIYKKAERLAKAIHLVAPAFRNSSALRGRLDQVAVSLVDASILPPPESRNQLSRELLALSSMLSIARSSGLLSGMNADLIAREAHGLLQEVAIYEEPRLFLEEAPTLASLAKDMTREPKEEPRELPSHEPAVRKVPQVPRDASKGHPIGQDSGKVTGRREAVISILKSKGPATIKDISTVIRDVSEKTIQRELQALVGEGKVNRSGERRWTTYSLVA